MAKATLEVSPESVKIVKAYAEKMGITVPEAGDKLITTADSRLKALSRYAKNQKKDAKPKAKKAGAKKSIAKPKKTLAVKPKAKKSLVVKKKASIAKPKSDKPSPAEVANGMAHP